MLHCTCGQQQPAHHADAVLICHAAAVQGGAQEGLPACAIRALPILIYEGKTGKHRRSSTGGSAPADTVQLGPSAPVPIAAGVSNAAGSEAGAAGNSGGAWLGSSPAMPDTPQAAAAAASRLSVVAGDDGQHSQRTDQVHSSAADTAVVLIESDSDADPLAAQQQGQQAGSLGHCLASSSSSAVTSGLISLASLAAAGSRRVLLLGGPSPSSSPLTNAADLAAAAARPCGHSSSVRSPAAAVDVPGASAAAAAAVGADGGVAGSGDATPTGSTSCRSSLYSTDDEDVDPPEVAQSWPGAGGMARVVTGGPVGARGGATRHTCVVCLERYSAGDKIRVLPCQHRWDLARCFHGLAACFLAEQLVGC